MAQTTLKTTETLAFPIEGNVQAAEPLSPDAQANEKKCEFCYCTATPMWRRGPTGKSTLCNACGVKWSIRKRNEPQEMPIQKPTPPTPEPKVKPRRGRKPKSQKTEEQRDVYYCRYCHMTWPITAFKNRQQFGAHCSNCSRKRKSRDLPAPVSVDRSLERPAKRQKPTWASKAYLEDQAVVETETPEENTALLKLLDAVEAVLEEEHELETLRGRLMSMRQTLNAVGTKRETELAGLREWLFAEFECLRKGATVKPRPFGRHETMGLRGFAGSPTKPTEMDIASFAHSSTRGNTSPVGNTGPTTMEIDSGAGSGLLLGRKSTVNTFETPKPRINTQMNGGTPVQNQVNPNGVHNGAMNVNMTNNCIMRQQGNVYLKSTLNQVVSLRVTDDQINKVKKRVLDQFSDVQASVYKKLDDLKATIGKNFENQEGQDIEQQRKALAAVDEMLVESREEIQSKFVNMTRDMQTTLDESRSEISSALQAYQKNFETALQNEDRALNCKLDNLRTKTQQKLVEVSVSLASVGTLLHPVIL